MAAKKQCFARSRPNGLRHVNEWGKVGADHVNWELARSANQPLFPWRLTPVAVVLWSTALEVLVRPRCKFGIEGTVRRSPREWARQTWEAAWFRIRSPKWDAVLTDELAFGDDGVVAFQQLLAGASSYLEFGSGASTCAAVRAGVPLLTVESDPRFLRVVETKCRALAHDDDSSPMVFVNANIGATGPWGKPILPSIARPKRWRNYPMAPWDLLGSDYRADAILIDGRFRVACALAVVLHQPDVEWAMLVDDYEGRGHYKAVEEFAELKGCHGRMALYAPKPRVDRQSLEAAFRHFASDWR